MSKENQDKLLQLLDEANIEGVQSMAATINKVKDDAYQKGHDDGYEVGYRAALNDVQITPTTEEQEEGSGIPKWNMESLPTRAFFDLLTPDGYKESDYSLIWPSLGQTDVDDGHAERNYPYVVHGKGDRLLVTGDDEPTQIITPYKEAFFIYCMVPNKTYRWRMMLGDDVIKEGVFQTIGRVRWMKTDVNKYPHNMRDLGCPKELVTEGNGIVWERCYRGEHPDNIEVGSVDHLYLRDQLGISVQINLRNPKDDPARSDLFEKTYSYNIPAYAAILTANQTYKDNFKNAFHALVVELKAGRNVLINCWQGRDRTGTFCWFLQALCHMAAGYLQGHWELSTFDRCENSMIWEEGHAEGKLLQMVSKFKAKWGADPYAQALGLAKFVGIPDADIKDFQDIMMAK